MESIISESIVDLKANRIRFEFQSIRLKTVNQIQSLLIFNLTSMSSVTIFWIIFESIQLLDCHKYTVKTVFRD